jgi:DNA-binding GntR family transcriptional regulator
MRPNPLRHSADVVPFRPVEAAKQKLPDTNRTLATDVFDRLRADILHCTLQPNSRLLFRDLRLTYESGMSPLRDALMRLAADGLVLLEDHKGFRVAPVSRDELVDVTATRCELEGLAIGLAIDRGDDSWEANILARFHELLKRPTYTAEGALDAEWERRHDAFHHALYSACGRRWLINFCQVLAERAFRYRHLLLEAIDRTRDHRLEHEAIVQAVLQRDKSRGVALLQQHYSRTAETLLGKFEELA